MGSLSQTIMPHFPAIYLHALLLTVFATCSFAQSFAPELAPVAEKYKADIAALDTQRTAALAQAQQSYTAALDAAEKTATTTRNLESVAAIAKERTAVKSGLMTPEFPFDLPKGLQTARKSYLDASTRIRTAEIPRRKAVDADYLRALANLQSRAGANSDLAQQLAAEKEKLLAGAASATASDGGSGKRSALINGGFDLADAEGRPSGWTLPDRKDASFKVVREGANSVLRATLSGEIRPAYVSQVVPIPPRAKTVTVSGRVRGKWQERDTKDGNWGANIAATYLGADERKFGGWVILVGGREAGQKALTKTGQIPDGAKALHLHFGFQFVTGSFDFDDIAVEFR